MKLIPVGVAAVMFLGCINPNLTSDHPRMPERGICAHRGASHTHPENTMAALRAAVRLGAQMIELDLAFSKDKRIVLMHDQTLDRTTNGKGRVSDWNVADLAKLDAGSWKGKEFEGEGIPTFEEALDIMPDNIWLNIHLKGGIELAQEATRLIRLKGRLHQAFLACGNDAASAARAIEPRIKICNMERQSNTLDYVNQTISSNREFIQLLGKGEVDPDHTAVLKENGIRINYCCTNDPLVLVELFSRGVEFPLVDRLEMMLNEADKLGIPRAR